MMPPNKEQRERLQRWFERGKQLRDHGPNIFQRVLDPRSALEGYRHGAIEAHFHVRISSGLLTENPKDFCARLESQSGGVGPGEHVTGHHAADGEVRRIDQSSLKITEVLGKDRLNLSVLVPTHEGVEQREGMHVPINAPGVRLVVLDDCPMARLYAAHPAVDLTREVLTVSANHKLWDMRSPLLWFRAPAYDIMSHIVQGGSEIRTSIADDKAPFRGHIGDGFDLEGEIVEVIIELFPEPERWFDLAVGPSPHVVLERVHVMLCPVEFVPATFAESTHD